MIIHRISLLALFSLCLCLAGCSVEQETASPADAPIAFAGGSATLVKMVDNGNLRLSSMTDDQKPIAVYFQCVLDTDVASDQAADYLRDNTALQGKDGVSYDGAPSMTVQQEDKTTIIMIYPVPKSVMAADLKLKAGDALFSLPKS